MKATKRGAVAESITITHALARGRDVLVPVRGLSPQYDMIVRGVDGKFTKWQVKRAYIRVRGGCRSLRANITDNSGKPYSSSEVDIIAVVDCDTNRVWAIPLRALGKQKTVALVAGKYDAYLL